MTSKLKRIVEILFGEELLISGEKRSITIYRGFPRDMDDKFKNIYKKCKDYTTTSIERMYALYKATEYIVKSKIPGDFVECGVWKGGSSMLMAYSLLQMKDTKRKIYLYDTFAGMTKPTYKDKVAFGNVPILNVWKSKEKDNYNEWAFSPLSEVKENMISTNYPQKNLVFVKGKVEDTIPKIIPSKIAMLRLDTDWYESTYHELNYLYPILTGGVC